MSTPTLRIRRWSNDIQVPRDCSSPERVRQELDAVAERLPDHLAAGLAPWFVDAGEPVLLIRRLRFDCELDISRDPEALVSRWAFRFARALAVAMESDSGEVLRFPSVAAYHARYIADLAQGCGANAWYHRTFAGLSHLSASAAIRTLLLEDPALGRATLAELPPVVWRRFEIVLSRREALRILEGLATDPAAEAMAPTALASLVAEAVERGPGIPWYVTALALLSAAMDAGLSPSLDLARFVRLAARLPELQAGPAASELAAALRRGDLAALVGAQSDGDAENWAPLLTRPEWRGILADALLTAERPSPGEKESGATGALSGEPSRTAYGGLALLLEDLDDLLDSAVTAALPEWGHGSARNLAAWLVLALCSGPQRRTAWLAESFWRDFFEIPPQLDLSLLQEWLSEGDAAHAQAALAARAMTLARGTPCLALLRIEARRRQILVEAATGLWLSQGPAPAGLGSWPEVLTATRRARADWRYLAPDWGLPGEWLWVFSHLAQLTCRRFAYRIPGMAGASLGYLYGNLLDSGGRFDPETDLLTLTRPPLHVLLNLTGIGRGTRRWPGPPQRELQLEYAP